MRVVVTGAAGFIGSNLVKALNDRGETDIIVVDDLTDGKKFANLADCVFAEHFFRSSFTASLHASPGTRKNTAPSPINALSRITSALGFPNRGPLTNDVRRRCST